MLKLNFYRFYKPCVLEELKQFIRCSEIELETFACFAETVRDRKRAIYSLFDRLIRSEAAFDLLPESYQSLFTGRLCRFAAMLSNISFSANHCHYWTKIVMALLRKQPKESFFIPMVLAFGRIQVSSFDAHILVLRELYRYAIKKRYFAAMDILLSNNIGIEVVAGKAQFQQNIDPVAFLRQQVPRNSEDFRQFSQIIGKKFSWVNEFRYTAMSLESWQALEKHCPEIEDGFCKELTQSTSAARENWMQNAGSLHDLSRELRREPAAAPAGLSRAYIMAADFGSYLTQPTAATLSSFWSVTGGASTSGSRANCLSNNSCERVATPGPNLAG